ncbi:Gti1/Pac2 family domain containing protein [Naviculisporaceae sp. PSN 640]
MSSTSPRVNAPQGQQPAPHPSPEPTCTGMIIADTIDAMLLITAIMKGELNHVSGRVPDRDRERLITSGNIFCYESQASGIKRWTDGVNWSPSRILGNCLVYRELLESLPPGEKKRAVKQRAKRPSNSGGVSKPGSGGNRQSHSPQAVVGYYGGTEAGTNHSEQDPRRRWIGSLVDSYGFKEGGLVKKTISLTLQGGLEHHIVSYYTLEDALHNRLRRPIEDMRFLMYSEEIPEALWKAQLRTPVRQEIDMFGHRLPQHDMFMGAINYWENQLNNLALFQQFPGQQLPPVYVPQYQGQPDGLPGEQQYFPANQNHLPQQYGTEHLPIQPYQVHGQMPDRGPILQGYPPSQAAHYDHEEAGPFEDAPLNDPTQQWQQHNPNFMMPTGGYFSPELDDNGVKYEK